MDMALCCVITVSALTQFAYGVHGSVAFYQYPDVYLDSYQLIDKYAHNPERHVVVTADGYLLNLYRIAGRGRPVLLVHGVADSSDSWLVMGPRDSLAFILAEAGFDVWLFNARGNKYGRDNPNQRPPEIHWDFTFEEIGTEDLTASIDYVLRTTHWKQLSYVGFSQGTTVFLIMCALKPEYNSLIDHAVLLAPVAWVHDIQYPFMDMYTKNVDALEKFASKYRIHEVFQSKFSLSKYHAENCREESETRLLCDLEYFLSYGLANSSYMPKERFPVIASHIPAGTSSKTFLHYLKNGRDRRFQRYDRGSRGNMKLYGSSHPPAYNMSSITVPVTMIGSEYDWFSSMTNVKALKKRLANVLNVIIIPRSEMFSHIEYVYGKRAKSFVNNLVVQILGRLSI